MDIFESVIGSHWWGIVGVLCLVWLVLVAFIKEWGSPDLIAMTAFCLLVVAGLLPVAKAYDVFSKPAPITIAAMFILSAALEKTGVIEWMGRFLNAIVSRRLWLTLPVLMLVVALCSAFVNNTPIVAVFLPLVLGISRRKGIPASKLLIPLSYAAVLGGCCTLIGTSTNLLVSEVAVQYGERPLEMFEFTRFGLVMLAIGIVYVTLVGPWQLPERPSVSAVLGPNERKQFLCHLLVNPESDLVGRRVLETDLADRSKGFRVVEIRRAGTRLTVPLNEVTLEAYDRVLTAVSSRQMQRVDGKETLKQELLDLYKVENLSTIQGAIIEGIIAPHSKLIGQTLTSSRFRQTYGMLVLGIHRKGRNVASAFQNAELRFGDTVLMLGPVSTFAQLREDGDFMLLEEQLPVRKPSGKAWISLLALGGVILISALGWMPIVVAATTACVLVLWAKCLSPQEAYQSIDWTVIFMLYGMIALGSVMESTGAASWLAGAVVRGVQLAAPREYLPLLALAAFYLIGMAMTEVLSNNATALILAPIAMNSATTLGLDPRPFIFVVAFSSSAAFSTPIGYQTHMMVYGAGGYRFSDYVKFGLPLNLLLWLAAIWFIPQFWPF